MTPPATLPPDPSRIRRLLVIRRKALGDAVVTLPAVLRLAAAFPLARVDLVVDRPYAPLLAALARGLVILPWPPRREDAGAAATPAGGAGVADDAVPGVPPGGWVRCLRAARYDLVVDYLGSPRTALWTALSGAPLRVGYDLRWRRWAYNVRAPRNREGRFPLAEFAGEGFLDPLRALGLPTAPWRPALAGGSAALGADYLRWRDGWRATPGRCIGLALSATWSAKAWPAGSAAALYRRAQAEGARPLIVTGPGDERLAASIRAELPDAAFTPPTTLPELADLLSGLDLLVATDCGPRHLAAALDVPTVTLFGPTDPRGWNPEHPRHVVVRTGETCSPCDLIECPIPGHPCMTGLTAEMVWTKVQTLLEATPRGAETAPAGERRGADGDPAARRRGRPG